MKFAHHLASHITPEWRKQYIQYDEMKDVIYKHHKQFLSDTDPEFRDAFLKNFEEKFLGFCQEELDKVASFYNEKIAFYSRLLLALKAELPKFCLHATGSTDFGYQFLQLSKKDFKKKHDLEMAFSELYLGMVLLQNYQELNYTGFRNILKKHDKLYETSKGMDWFSAKVEVAAFHIDPSVDKQIQEIEDIVTEAFEDNDRGKALRKLRVPPLDEHITLKTFALGVFTGALIFSLEQIVLAVYNNAGTATYDGYTIIRLYRGYFLVCLYIFFCAVNVVGWRRAGVNHILIFELDPRSHLEAQHLFTMSAFLACVASLSFIGFLEARSLGIRIYIFPLLLMIFFLFFLFNPFNFWWREARWWVLKVMGRVLTTGFHGVTFAEFWLMDQMQSLTPVMLDFEYALCLFSTSSGQNDWSPWWKMTEARITSTNGYHEMCSSRTSLVRAFLRIAPSLIRFVQCLRRYHDRRNPWDHLVNAGKYFVAIMGVTSSVVLAFTEERFYPGSARYSNPAFYIWILISIASTVYSYYWDVKKDWGLFDAKAEVKYLREELVYNSKYFYYFAMASDLILRFSWAISLSITENRYISGDIMLTITAPLEIWRRFIWNFFRLENEHLNNVGDFRALRDIAIRPIPKTQIGSKEVRKTVENDEGSAVVVEIIKIKPSISSNTSVPPTGSYFEAQDDEDFYPPRL